METPTQRVFGDIDTLSSIVDNTNFTSMKDVVKFCNTNRATRDVCYRAVIKTLSQILDLPMDGIRPKIPSDVTLDTFNIIRDKITAAYKNIGILLERTYTMSTLTAEFNLDDQYSFDSDYEIEAILGIINDRQQALLWCFTGVGLQFFPDDLKKKLRKLVYGVSGGKMLVKALQKLQPIFQAIDPYEDDITMLNDNLYMNLVTDGNHGDYLRAIPQHFNAMANVTPLQLIMYIRLCIVRALPWVMLGFHKRLLRRAILMLVESPLTETIPMVGNLEIPNPEDQGRRLTLAPAQYFLDLAYQVFDNDDILKDLQKELKEKGNTRVAELITLLAPYVTNTDRLEQAFKIFSS